MLERLDAIDWASLQHAYGPAEDVPGLLRALASPEEEQRQAALEELWGNIWHQGTVYEASAYAVPFLIELLEAPAVRRRDEILFLLQALATGSSYLEVHQEIVCDRRERSTPEFAAKLGREQGYVRAAHDAVLQDAPVYLRLLADPEAQVRRMVPYLLAVCGERRAEIAPALRSRIDGESDPLAKASQILGQSRLEAEAGAPPAAWLDDLGAWMRADHEAPVVRLAAALSLGVLRGEGPCPELLPALREALPAGMDALAELPWGDGDTLRAMDEFLRAQPELRLQLLLDLARNPDAGRRRDAIYALEEHCLAWRSAAEVVAPLLGEALADPDGAVRECAARALAALGPAAEPSREGLSAALKDPSAAVRWHAATALAKLGDARAGPALVALLDEPEYRSVALDSLRRLGAAALPALPCLRRMLRAERDEQLRIRAVLVLGAMGPAAGEALPDLLAALKYTGTAASAAHALEGWGAEGRGAVPLLVAALRSPDPYLRRNAARALGAIGPAAAAPQQDVPRNPLQRLVILAVGADDLARALAARLHDRDAGVRIEAAFALWQIQERSQAVPVLAAALHEGLSARHQEAQFAGARAAECLSRIGPAAAPAVPVLREALGHDLARVHAARALWSAGGPAEEMLPVLIDEVRGRPSGLVAIEGLAEMGPLARDALPVLRRVIESERRVMEVSSTDALIEEDEAFRAAAGRALASIQGG